MEGLAVGRFVHYVLNNGEHRAAVVVRVFDSGAAEGLANLQVFLDGSNDNREGIIPMGATEHAKGILWATSAHYDDAGDKPHTWHWPERV